MTSEVDALWEHDYLSDTIGYYSFKLILCAPEANGGVTIAVVFRQFCSLTNVASHAMFGHFCNLC